MSHITRHPKFHLVAVALVIGAAIVLVIPTLRAQQEDPPQSPAMLKHNPFELYPTGPGAIPYDQLVDTAPAEIDPDEVDLERGIHEDVYRAMTAETKSSVDNTAEWAETQNGYDTAQAWSAYTDLMVLRAQEKEAEYLSGLSNIGDVGI